MKSKFKILNKNQSSILFAKPHAHQHHIYLSSFPIQPTSDSEIWANLDQQSENLDDTNEFDQDQCSLDVASELLSEEEQMLTDDDDKVHYNTIPTEEVNGQAGIDDDIEIDFSSLKLNSNQSSVIDHFKLLNNIKELMRKSFNSCEITNEYIQKQMTSINDVNKTGLLVLDMFNRWNSSFRLFNRLIIHKDTLKSMFTFPNNLFGLNDQQI